MFKIASDKSIIACISIIIYRVLLDINYLAVISPVYSYSGFVNSITGNSCIVSYMVLLLSIPFVVKLYRSKRFFLSNVIALLYLMCFVPGTSLMAFIPMDFYFLVLYILYWLILLWGALHISPIKMPVLSERNRNILLYAILGIMTGAVLYVSGKYAGFRIHLSLRDVYDLRDEERSWNLPLLLGYLLPTAGTILPVFLVYFLAKKQKWLVLLLSVVILLNFSIGGHKSLIFKLFLCFLGYWFYDGKKIRLYVWFLISLCCISLIEWKLIGYSLTSTFIIRRVLYVPAYLNYDYYNYFSTHELDLFRQSFLRHFGFASPYGVPIPKLIGEVYYNAEDMNANNGLFSDAYSNLGTVGVLLFPFLLLLVINIIDSVSKGIDVKLLILPVIVVERVFSSGTLMSGLVTGGILILIFVLSLFPKGELKS